MSRHDHNPHGSVLSYCGVAQEHLQMALMKASADAKTDDAAYQQLVRDELIAIRSLADMIEAKLNQQAPRANLDAA